MPRRGGRQWSLATMINKQLWEEEDPPAVTHHPRRKRGTDKDPMESLRCRVSAKLEEGDFKGAIRLAVSEDSLAESSESTYSVLKEKHPPPHPASSIPPLLDGAPLPIAVSEGMVVRAIKSFPNGSAGGPDGLRPQHLKDMISSSDGADSPLLIALAAFSAKGRCLLPSDRTFWGLPSLPLRKRGEGLGLLRWGAPFVG